MKLEKKGLGQKKHYAYVILAAASVFYAATVGLVLNSRGIYHQPVCSELGFRLGDLTVYQACYGIGAAALLPFVNKLFARFSMRKVLLAAAVAFGVCAMAMGAFTSLWQWYAAGAIQGLAGAVLQFTALPYLLSRWFTARQGAALGFAAMFSGFAGILSNMLGALLINSMGWRAAYAIVGAVCLALALPAAWVVRDDPKEMGLLPFGGLPEGEAEAHTPARLEKRVMGPVAGFLAIAVIWAFASSYLQHIASFAAAIGMSAMHGAAMVSCSMGGNLVGKVALGALNDKITVGRASYVGVAAVAAAFACYTFFQGSPVLLYAASFVLGFTLSLAVVQLPQLVRSVFPQPLYLRVFPFISIGTALASCGGSAAVGLLYEISSYTVCFIVALVLMLAGMLLQRLVCRWRG